MSVLENIKNNFNRGFFGKAMLIEGLPQQYPAWTIKQPEWYGVAVRTDKYIPFSEKFSSSRIWTLKNAEINNQPMNLLVLACSDMKLRSEFATICSQFVRTSPDGRERKEIISNPAGWWDNWKSLLGNAQVEREVYSKIGELLVVEKLLLAGKRPKWVGIENATNDVELNDRSYEVKSTIKRYGYEVEISSIYQLNRADKELNLVFLRFEKSELGRSLDDIVNSVVDLGLSEESIENSLSKTGLEYGCMARKNKYKLLELRVFPVDDSFPALTLDSFVGGTLPPNIVGIKYVVDLSGVPSRSEL